MHKTIQISVGYKEKILGSINKNEKQNSATWPSGIEHFEMTPYFLFILHFFGLSYFMDIFTIFGLKLGLGLLDATFTRTLEIKSCSRFVHWEEKSSLHMEIDCLIIFQLKMLLLVSQFGPYIVSIFQSKWSMVWKMFKNKN